MLKMEKIVKRSDGKVLSYLGLAPFAIIKGWHLKPHALPQDQPFLICVNIVLK